MHLKRKRYPTKRQWAEAQIAELETLLSTMLARHVPASNWRGVRAKMAGLESVRRDLAKYRRLAEHFAAEGC